MTLSNISDDLDKTLYLLLKPNLDAALDPEQVDVSFAAPKKGLDLGLNGKMMSLFLYDLREDLELRASENLKFRTQPGAGATQTSLKRPPVNVIYSYMVTAWSAAGANAETDEHYLLNKAIDILLGFPELPQELLQGSLAEMTPKPRMTILTPNRLGSLGELWNSMGDNPKPMVNLTITLPRQIPDIDAMLVASASYSIDQKKDAANP